jgi:hypothetical protein
LGHDDADDEAGTIGTDSARDFDPVPLLRALHEAGARVAVIGQVAGILHGSRELTGDLDLLWDGDPAQAEALAKAFAAVGAELLDDDHRPLPLTPQAFLLPKVQFESPNASGDCCTVALPWGTLPVRDFLDRALTVSSPDGLDVHYLRREDLIAMRARWDGRRTCGAPRNSNGSDSTPGEEGDALDDPVEADVPADTPVHGPGVAPVRVTRRERTRIDHRRHRRPVLGAGRGLAPLRPADRPDPLVFRADGLRKVHAGPADRPQPGAAGPARAGAGAARPVGTAADLQPDRHQPGGGGGR